MIFATGKSGTLGKYLPKSVAALNFRENLKDILNKKLINSDATIIHLAGIVGESQVRTDPDTAKKVNVDKTLEFARRAIELDIKNFLYISSSHVYATSSSVIDEESAVAPISMYASQKAEAENLLSEMFTSSNSNLTILRVFSVLDIGTAHFTLGGALTRIVQEDANIRISNSDDIRDFLTPRIIANSIYEVSLDPQDGIFNLCSGIGRTVYGACEDILIKNQMTNIDQFFERGNSSTPVIIGSNKKIMEAFPQLDLTWEYGNETK